MKPNDWIALDLNLKDSGLKVEDLRAYNITPSNTELKEKEYYKNIPQVQAAFKDEKTGQFNDSAFDDYYNSVKRSYTDFAEDDYVTNLINSIPSSRNDIFSLGNTNIRDDSAYIVNSKDPQRHSVGIGNIFETGAASFSEREVAQANRATDENGNDLGWSPNDKGGLFKALFRPTLALAQYDEDVFDDNGNLIHAKGERKYNQWGDPYYEKLGDREVYGRDVLHLSDTLSKEGTFVNKIDIFDKDGIKTSAAKTLTSTLAKIAPYLTPYGYVFGAIEAASALGQTLPVLTKMLNGFITGSNDNAVGKIATSVENYMARFKPSQSDYQQQHQWGLEGVSQMVLDSAKQLYSQRLIQKIPGLVRKMQGLEQTVESQKLAMTLSTAYMAATSAQDVYGDYIEAGVNDRFAGIGALATMGAFWGLMQNEYFKDMLFRDSAIELPELKILLGKEVKTTTKALAERQATNAGLNATKAVVETAKVATNDAEKKWYQRVYNGISGKLKEVLPKIKQLSLAESGYLYTSRGLNEGIEEVMEEGVTDAFKGMTLGLNSLGLNVKSKDADAVDFGFTPQNFLERYATSFAGGFLGGVVFEGLTQWDNKVLHRNIKRIADLKDTDEQLDWYIRNGYEGELLDIIDRWERKGKLGSKELSWNYEIQTDAEGNKKLVYNTGTTENNQNTGMANIMRQRIRYKKAQLEALGLNITDNEILLKATLDIADEAKKAGKSGSQEELERWKEENLRDERIEFLKQTGVDKFIISDVADLQKQLEDIQEKIDAAEYVVTDKDNQQPADENTLKEYRRLYNEKKKQLDDILNGKRTSEYLSLGIYMGDQPLVDLYVSDLSTKDGRTYAEASLENFVRARYGEDLNELKRNKGNGIVDLFASEYEAWLHEKNKKARIRHAFNIHQFLTQQITPIVMKQVAEYNGYKMEDLKSPLINGLVKEQYLKQIQLINKQLESLDQSDPKYQELNQQKLKLIQDIANLDDPNFILEQGNVPDSEGVYSPTVKAAIDAVQSMDAGTILSSIINYYEQLNNTKTVSEFSDNIMKAGLQGLRIAIMQNAFSEQDSDGNLVTDEFGEPVRIGSIDAQYKNAVDYLNDFDIAEKILDLIQNNEELKNSMHVVGDETLSEAVILSELMQEWQNNLRNGGDGKFEYAGKTMHFFDHLMRADLFSALVQYDEEDNLISPLKQELDEYEKRGKLYEWVLSDKSRNRLISLTNDLISALSKNNIDLAISTYNSINQFLKSLGRQDSEQFVNSLLFGQNVDFEGQLNKIKELRSNMIHTPILEWIQNLASVVNGLPVNLWQMLQDEFKGLASKDRLDQYVITNPFALSELNYLVGALKAAKAVARGMIPGQVNAQLNKIRKKDKLDELFVFDNKTLSDIYQNDLDILEQRISYLLDLHSMNQTGTVKAKKLSMVRNAPKIISAILKTSTGVNEKDPEPFVSEELKKIGIDDIKALWSEAGGDSIDLNAVTEENFNEFWKVYRNFQNLIYARVSAWNPTQGDKAKEIAKNLVNGFTDAWKMKTSTLTHKEDSKVEPYDVLMWLASTIAVDPKTTNGLIKTVKSQPNTASPFFDQLLDIQTSFAALENNNLFNAIVDELAEKAKAAINEQSGIEDAQKAYIEAKTKIHNAVFIDGSAGTGKSQVVLKYIREMRKLLHPNRRVIAASQYAERTKTLKSSLGLSNEDLITKDELIEKLIGRKLTNDDFVPLDEARKNGHFRVLKPDVIKELKKNLKWDELIGDKEGVDIYIDESGFLSEGDLQLFSELVGDKDVRFIYAGDEMQNGYTTKISSTASANSGTFDVTGIRTLRLNLSMRAGNLGMIKNLDTLETYLKMVMAPYRDTPWMRQAELDSKVAALSPFKFKYWEDDNSLFGVAFTSNPTEALEKLERISKKGTNGPKIVIITDDLDKWKSRRSENIDVLDVGQVQGGEYDYALIDVKDFGKDKTFDYLRNIYTLISRAKTGVYINGELGSLFPKTTSDDMDNTASTIVNPSASDEDDNALTDYSDFFNKLYEGETWSSTPTPPNPASTTGSTTGPAPGNPGSVPSPSENNVGETNFDEKAFLEEIKENGEDSEQVNPNWNSAKKRDYANYKKYYELRAETNGRYSFSQDYIDWLDGDTSDDIVFSKNRTILNSDPLTAQQKKQYKVLVKTLAMDLMVLDAEAIKNKYKKATEIHKLWVELYQNDTQWEARVEKLFEDISSLKMSDASGEYLPLYAVKEGDNTYLYYVTKQKQVFPISIIKNGPVTGAVKLYPHQAVPMIMVSSNGRKFAKAKDVFGKYAHLSKKAHILTTDPASIPISQGSGLKGFILENSGVPMGIASPTWFDNDDSEVLSAVKDEDGRYYRIDSTGQKQYIGNESEPMPRKRLSGLSKLIGFTEWLEISKLLIALRDHNPEFSGLSTEDLIHRLSPYVPREVSSTLSNNENDLEVFNALRRAQILSPRSRNLLTTALIRYFWNRKETAEYTTFKKNLRKYITTEYDSKDGTARRQKGLSFTIYGKHETEEVYRILLIGDSKTDENLKFGIYTYADENGVGKEVSVGELEGFSTEELDPEKIASSVLSKIKEWKKNEENKTAITNTAIDSPLEGYFNSNEDTLDINTLFKEASISIGLTTRSIKKENGQVTDHITYFQPFDTDIARLFTGLESTTTKDGELDKFLKSDSKFKYNFIANTQGEGDDDWIDSIDDTDVLYSDIIAVLPPVFNIDTTTLDGDVRFTDLGTLEHKIETSNPAESKIEVHKDINGNVTEYKFLTRFTVTKDQLKPYVSNEDYVELPITLSISSYDFSNKKILYYGSDGTNSEVSIIKDASELFKDIPKQDISTGNRIAKSGDIELIKDGDRFILKIKDISKSNFRVISYTGNKLLLWSGRVIQFNVAENSSDVQKLVDTVNKLSYGTYVGQTFDTDNNPIGTLFLSGNTIIEIDSDGKRTIYDNVSITSDTSFYSGSIGNNIVVPKEVITALRNGGIQEKPVQKSESELINDAISELAKTNNLVWNETQGLTVDDANNWAMRNAVALNGIYRWNGKEFIKSDTVYDKVLMRFVKDHVNQDRTAQEILLSNNLKIDINDGVATITLDGITQKFQIAFKRDNIELRLIEDETDDIFSGEGEDPFIGNVQKIINAKQNISDKDRSYLILLAQAMSGRYAVDTSNKDFLTWVDQIQNNEELLNAQKEITDLIFNQNNNSSC